MGFFSSIGNFFKRVGRGIWNGIKSVGRGVWNGVKNIGKRVVSIPKSCTEAPRASIHHLAVLTLYKTVNVYFTTQTPT
ncbi:hypothetical protein TVAG_195050 [Trichomonas vaginalis G3]|uniref:Uncharacterized protein n=1 Tax=Trichomonas vaginalis (strain ATCC PRA-98 / G3) TaxID=412133 RepID=A2FZL6_TRIV3|nr:hypothetical protein TVAG_195050 [Trichomonas vaginalis G3]|eukprot:XP_001302581.1 hypothetical protein [Trichomonas vaginalis G3]